MNDLWFYSYIEWCVRMYGEAYRLLITSPPGKRLDKNLRKRLVGEFEADSDLVPLIRYTIEKDRPSSAAKLWRELRSAYADSPDEFQSIINDSRLPSTLEEAEATDQANAKTHGDSLLTVSLPRSCELATRVYRKLVLFCRKHALCLRSVDLATPRELPPNWWEFTADWRPPSLPGFFFSFRENESSKHFAGGENRLSGGDCPNCRKPLMRHLTLCTEDEQLSLGELGIRELPLLFCMRCNLGYDDDFVYRVIDDATIELLKYSEGSDAAYSRDWHEEVGVDVFPRRSISLLPITLRVQELLDVMNRWYPAPPDEMTETEKAELQSLLAQYDNPFVGAPDPPDRSYVTNQVGGRPYLPQSLMFPECSYCKESTRKTTRMHVIANLTNDELNDFVVSFPTVYITFFLCTDCRSVHVEHRI